MIESVAAFQSYFESVRRRTLNFCAALPEERVDWAPQPGEFTCGDIVRHLAASEQMFVTVALTRRWYYPGHERSLGADLRGALAYLEASHMSAVAALGSLGDAALGHTCEGVGGHPIKIWRLLMLMAEHEVHHRSQLSSYLSLMGVEPPQLYGLHLEEVISYGEGDPARAWG
ncbi:MAG: DinB family protein [Oscillochloris sp.]|nr:DinB family protein [Oscillochloris sp.]